MEDSAAYAQSRAMRVSQSGQTRVSSRSKDFPFDEEFMRMAVSNHDVALTQQNQTFARGTHST